MVASGHVRFWHKADIPLCTAHVRYWGVERTGTAVRMQRSVVGNVRFRGEADITILRRSVLIRKAEFTWLPRSSASAMANALSFFSSGGM